MKLSMVDLLGNTQETLGGMVHFVTCPVWTESWQVGGGRGSVTGH
jgi:hypothetical protein